MEILNFFKNKLKLLKKTDILKLISDIAIPDISGLSEFNEQVAYKKKEKVLYFNNIDNKFMILQAIQNIPPGKIDLSKWNEFSIEQPVTSVINTFFNQFTLSYTTVEDGQMVIPIPTQFNKFNPMQDSFILCLNSTIITDDNYYVKRDGSTLSFNDMGEYTDIPKGSKLEFIFNKANTFKENIPNNNINTVTLPPQQYSYVLKADDISVQKNEVCFEVDIDHFDPSTDVLYIFVGVLNDFDTNFLLDDRKVTLKYVLPVGTTISYVVQKQVLPSYKYGKILPISTVQQAIEGTDNTTVMTPFKVSKKIESNGCLNRASDEEAAKGSSNESFMTPALTKLAIDNHIRCILESTIKERVEVIVKASDNMRVFGQILSVNNLTNPSRSAHYVIHSKYIMCFIEPGDSYEISVNEKENYITPEPIRFGPAVAGRSLVAEFKYLASRPGPGPS